MGFETIHDILFKLKSLWICTRNTLFPILLVVVSTCMQPLIYQGRCETACLLLISPDGERFEYVLQLSFHASNNEAEYEALLAGLSMVKYIGVINLLILRYSQLVVSQLTEEYQANEP